MFARNSEKNVLSTALDARLTLPFALLIFVLLLAMAAGSISRTRDLLYSHETLERNNLVLHEIDGLEDSLQEAREAALHYVLTPEKVDLVNFDEAVAQTWAHLDRISVMTRDDKGYPERVEQLRGLIRNELRQWADDMRTVHTLLIFHTPDSDANRDRASAAIQKFKNDEEEILRAGNDAYRSRVRQVERSTPLLVGGFSVLVAVLSVLVILGSRNMRIARQSTQIQFAGSVQHLQSESVAAGAGGDGKSKSD